jgi:cyclic dehypoxanthinyl futalosine synthase
MNATPRLQDDDALARYRGQDLHELASEAHAACLARHGRPYRTFAIDRNINYTNICTCGCAFCAFSAHVEHPDGWVLPREELLAKTAELAEAGGTHVLLQGGMNPSLSLEWHEEMLRDIRGSFPRMHIHGLSPPEIWSLHVASGLSVDVVLDRLRTAGLDTIPGGGAEILVDRVRRRISPRKCSADQWLEVMRRAHAMDIHTTATMMFAHVETDAERIEHLRRLRELQDESLDGGRGRFTAFICWTFQAGNTPLLAELRRQAASGRADGEDEPVFFPLGAHAYLRTLALARLYLDNFENLQASWVTQGAKIGQLSLFYGANDMGGVMMEENVVSAAGTAHPMTPDDLRHLIRDAGWQPRQRNVYYELVD